jgi:transcriptional regulator with XRE-family HTH domain
VLISRAITDDEVPHLLRMGARLEQLRMAAGMSRRAVADATGMNPQSIFRIERGLRRTRRRTLYLLAGAVSEDAEAAAAELVRLAGPALAPESPWVHRIERRRQRRLRKLQVQRQREEYQARRAAQLAHWHRSRVWRSELSSIARSLERLFRR